MVTGALIQSKVAKGFAIAASKIGDQYQHYRPAGASAPIVMGNLLGSVSAQFSADSALKFAKPSLFGKPVWYGLFDSTVVLGGDYLIGQEGTFYVCDIERFSAPACVICNRTISITRQPATITPGAAANYGGDVAQNETAVITGWPASVLMLGTRSTSGSLQLPSEGKQGVVQVLLPNTVPVTILEDDIITDDFGKRYEVSSAELTAVGWRLNAEEWEV